MQNQPKQGKLHKLKYSIRIYHTINKLIATTNPTWFAQVLAKIWNWTWLLIIVLVVDICFGALNGGKWMHAAGREGLGQSMINVSGYWLR